ncbi:MAG: DUF4928 domain-containing protein [bacterium]|nr:DUF4928 domain-containing protein [bacterium]
MIEEQLRKFLTENNINGKGPLSVMLVMTRRAISEGLPLDRHKQLSKQRGQVKGLGKAPVQMVLKDYGITRVLSEEGGRTSRGSIKNMQDYVEFLNRLSPDKKDLQVIEKWWVDRVRDFFAGKPFKMKIDQSKSLHSIISDLLRQAKKRQQVMTGTMYLGTVMQHLVGAKLELALKSISIEHHGVSVADAPTERRGDFLIGDSVIHVTTTPNEALLNKCKINLDANYRPIIVTNKDRVDVALALAENIGIKDRLDVLEILQFVATNIYELSFFNQSERPLTFKELVEKYNTIIEKFETDPSLKIETAR